MRWIVPTLFPAASRKKKKVTKCCPVVWVVGAHVDADGWVALPRFASPINLACVRGASRVRAGIAVPLPWPVPVLMVATLAKTSIPPSRGLRNLILISAPARSRRCWCRERPAPRW